MSLCCILPQPPASMLEDRVMVAAIAPDRLHGNERWFAGRHWDAAAIDSVPGEMRCWLGAACKRFRLQVDMTLDPVPTAFSYHDLLHLLHRVASLASEEITSSMGPERDDVPDTGRQDPQVRTGAVECAARARCFVPSMICLSEVSRVHASGYEVRKGLQHFCLNVTLVDEDHVLPRAGPG